MQLFKKNDIGIVLLIFLSAAFLRFLVSTAYFGTSGDDFCNIWSVHNMLNLDFRRCPGLFMWFYYYASGVLAFLAGDSYLALKLVSIFFASASIVCAYLIVKRVFNKAAACLAAFLLIFHPEFMLIGSTSLREPVYTFFILSAILCLSLKLYLTGALMIALSFLTRLEGLWIGMVAYMICLIAARVRKRTAFITAGIFILSFLFLNQLMERNFLGTLKDVYNFTAWEHHLPEKAALGRSCLLGLSAIVKEYPLIIFSLLGFGVIPFIMGLYFIAGEKRLSDREHLNFLVFLCVHILVWMGYIFIFKGYLYWCWRYQYPLIPFLIAYVSYGLAKLYQEPGRKDIAVFLVILVFVFQPYIFLNKNGKDFISMNRHNKMETDFSRWIEANIPEDAALLVDGITFFYMHRKGLKHNLVRWEDCLREVSAGPESLLRFLARNDIKFVAYSNMWWAARKAAYYLEENKRIDSAYGELSPLSCPVFKNSSELLIYSFSGNK